MIPPFYASVNYKVMHLQLISFKVNCAFTFANILLVAFTITINPFLLKVLQLLFQKVKTVHLVFQFTLISFKKVILTAIIK